MNDFNPFISIIIPTFNRAYVLERAINSVMEQTYKNFELIIIDDGSTDDTKILLSKSKNHKMKIYYIENSGVSKARNFGIQKSKGDYISFLDSDDEWLKEKLIKQVDLLETDRSLKWVHTEEIWVRNGVRVNQMNKHKKAGGDQFIPSLKMCMISPSTVLIERSVLFNAGMFREDYPVCEDYDLWLKLSAQFSIGFVAEPLIRKYGGHDDQLSRKYFAMDYYRIKSIDWVLTHLNLCPERLLQAKKVILNKCKILIKGYKKHHNLAQLPEIQKIESKYFEENL